MASRCFTRSNETTKTVPEAHALTKVEAKTSLLYPSTTNWEPKPGGITNSEVLLLPAVHWGFSVDAIDQNTAWEMRNLKTGLRLT